MDDGSGGAGKMDQSRGHSGAGEDFQKVDEIHDAPAPAPGPAPKPGLKYR